MAFFVSCLCHAPWLLSLIHIYKTLEIKARHNEKGRMTHCPKRFWADMVELQGEL